MTMDEEMGWEDYQGFPRPTRQPYKCRKCGKTLHTRETYISHTESCEGNRDSLFKKKQTDFELKRQKEIEENLQEFKRQHGIR